MKLFKFSMFSLFVFGLLLSSNLVLAVEKASVNTNSSEKSTLVPLARVNILDAKIVSSNESTFNIFFKISNGEGLQGGVRYGVKLFSLNDKGQPGVIVDEKVFPESLSLAADSILDKEIVYDAPKILSGSFMLAVSSENESGFPFGLNPVGKINLVASIKGVKILNETCSTKLETKETNKESKNLILNQGDKVRLTCTAINSENESVSVIPYFETNLNSAYGKQVEALGGDTTVITFNKLEKKTFSVILPQPKDPQVYYTKTMLKEGGQYSNAIGTTYVVNGTSASIENLFFDKDYFKNGDTANLSILWTSRSEISDDLSLNISIANKDDNKCGEVVNQVLSQSTANIKTNIPITITKNCINPKALVAISDKAGKVLDQKTFNIETKSIDVSGNKFDLVAILIIVGIVLIIIVGFILYMKKKNKSDGNPINIPPQMTVLLFLIACSFIPFNSVKAYTFSFPGSAARVTISSEKASFSPGNYTPAGVVKMNASFALNGVSPSNLRLRIAGKNFTITDGGYDSVTFTAPNTLGTFNTTVAMEANNPIATFSSCSGTYSNTSVGRCTGGSGCGVPDEYICGETFNARGDQCEWSPGATNYYSCSGFSQSVCNSHSECTKNYLYPSNWNIANTTMSYMIALPTPVVTVSASYGLVDMGQPVKVTWGTNNYSTATNCKGSMVGSGVTSFDFIGDGRVSGSVDIIPTAQTIYTVTCTNNYTSTSGSCSGTYTNTTGVCNGGAGHVAGSVAADGSTPGPYEGQACSSLSQAVCGTGWITHGCSTWTPTTTTSSCGGLSQSACLNTSGCNWTVIVE